MKAQYDPQTGGVKITMSDGLSFVMHEGDKGGLSIMASKSIVVRPRASNSVEIMRAP